MKTLSIALAERRSHSSIFSGETREGWFVRATIVPNGGSVNLSRFDDESGWTVDAMFTDAGLPTFVNGFGARALVTQRLNAETASVVDAYIAGLAS